MKKSIWVVIQEVLPHYIKSLNCVFWDLKELLAIFQFKGTVSDISIYPSCQDDNAWLTLVPLKPVSDLKKLKSGIYILSFLNVIGSDKTYIFFCINNVQVTFLEKTTIKK